MTEPPKMGETVRVRRQSRVEGIWGQQTIEYYGRIVGVDGGVFDVLDDARQQPGEPGAIRREDASDVTVGWWERVWHEGRQE